MYTCIYTPRDVLSIHTHTNAHLPCICKHTCMFAHICVMYVCMYLVQKAIHTQLVDVYDCNVTIVEDHGVTSCMHACMCVCIYPCPESQPHAVCSRIQLPRDHGRRSRGDVVCVCMYVYMYLVEKAGDTQLVDVYDCHVTIVEDHGVAKLVPWCAHVRILRLYMYIHACMYVWVCHSVRMYVSSDCMYIHVCMYVWVCHSVTVCVYVCMYICIRG